MDTLESCILWTLEHELEEADFRYSLPVSQETVCALEHQYNVSLLFPAQGLVRVVNSEEWFRNN